MKETKPRILPRGRIALWTREQLDKLSTAELRALLANATNLNEVDVAAMCNAILSSRPNGHPRPRRRKAAATSASE